MNESVFISDDKILKSCPELLQCYLGGDPSVDWKALEEEPAERLRNIGVNIFVVGTTPIAEMDEMQMISGSESHSILLQNYNDLDGIIPPLVSRICNIASVVKRSESPESKYFFKYFFSPCKYESRHAWCFKCSCVGF